MKKITYIFLLTFFLAACVKEKIDMDKISAEIDVSPSLVVPLAYGNITIGDILPETDDDSDVHIFTDENNGNLLHIRYNSVIDSFNMSKFIDPVPDQSSEVEFISGSDFITNAFNNGTPVNFEKNIIYEFKPGDGNGMLLDYFVIKSGTLKLNVTADFNATGIYTIEMPEFKHPTKGIISESFDAANPSIPHEIDLAGYSVGLLTDGQRNSLDVVYKVAIEKNDEDINNGSKITCAIETQNLAIGSFYGYLGQYVTGLELYTLDLDFSSQFDGNLYIADPRISLIIENSFGFPIRTTLSDMKAIITDGDDIDFIVNPPNNPKNIAYPSFANPNEIGQIKHDTLFINNTTSNIAEILSSLPDQMTMAGKFEINPDNDQSEQNFVTEDSYLKASVALDLPINFGLTNFVYSDTLEMDLEETITNLEDVTNLQLDISFDNGLPIGFEAELYFYEQKSENDPSMALNPINITFFENNKISVASANTTNGIVSSVQNTFLNITVTDEQLEKLKSSKFMILKLYVDTNNPDNTPNYSVKIHSTDSFGFKIGAKASASVQLD